MDLNKDRLTYEDSRETMDALLHRMDEDLAEYEARPDLTPGQRKHVAIRRDQLRDLRRFQQAAARYIKTMAWFTDQARVMAIQSTMDMDSANLRRQLAAEKRRNQELDNLLTAMGWPPSARRRIAQDKETRRAASIERARELWNL